MHEFWTGLWSPEQAPHTDLEPWLAPLRALLPFPSLQSLTPELLWEVVRGTSKGKASGVDGWSYKEMADWPLALFAHLATFLALVEEVGRWPATWAGNLVCLLPKGGTASPEDRRPIVLLSCIYRVWAACRAQIFRAWLRQNGILLEGEACGPDVKAGELGVRLASARLSGDIVSGLALDWSECYDRLPLAVLETLAQAAKLPPALWRPMLAAYALPRRVRADEVAGPECDPVCGLAPGCPAATDWLALLVFCSWSSAGNTRLRR